METKVLLREEMTVNDIIHRNPATIAVFHRFGIDACCGGALPLAEAAARHGRSLAELQAALDVVADVEAPPISFRR